MISRRNRLPEKVTLIEVGPRDGFQFESRIIPTALKVDIIGGLVTAGIKHIQATSFVHPLRVPQMADAESLLQALPRWDGVTISGLVLNQRGLERAHHVGLMDVEISLSASDTHSRKNSGMPLDVAARHARQMVRFAKAKGMHVRAGIQCAFGCVYEGDIGPERVARLVLDFMEDGVDAVAFSDTTGMATPGSVRRLLAKAMPVIGGTPAVVHLHDTRGLGLVNLMAALECGITRFDSSLAGMGGCPFVPGAAGNIATEDVVYLLNSLQINTGIDIGKVAECSLKLERFLGKRFAGKIYRLAIPGNDADIFPNEDTHGLGKC